MLKVIGREIVWNIKFASRLVAKVSQPSSFSKSEHASTEISGKWDETIFSASDVNAYQDASKILAFTDSRGTKGSFVLDVDKNVLLDLCGTENFPLGHNHSALTNLADKQELDSYVLNSNLDSSAIASGQFVAQVSKVLAPIAPSNLQSIVLTGGRNATEHALMDAFKLRQIKNIEMSALGFAGSNHGQGLAMAQFAHPKMSMTLNWPILEYPQSISEEQTLEKVRSSIQTQKSTAPVAAVILEPVNWQTGSQMSRSLIDQIGKIAHEFEAALIVDETNSGCGATGNGFWAYGGSAADYVTFGKRTQVTGYFKQGNGAQISLGGPEFDVQLFAVIKKEIDGLGLIEQVNRVGKSLHTSVSRASEKSKRITSVNSVGTMMWINTANAKDAQELRDHLRRQGVLVKLNGSKGVMTKPALTLQEHQASTLSAAVAKF